MKNSPKFKIGDRLKYHLPVNPYKIRIFGIRRQCYQYCIDGYNGIVESLIEGIEKYYVLDKDMEEKNTKKTFKFKVGDFIKSIEGPENKLEVMGTIEGGLGRKDYSLMDIYGNSFSDNYEMVELNYEVYDKMEENLNKEYQPKFKIRDFVTTKLSGNVVEIKSISHTFSAGDKNGTYYYEIYDINGKKHECESKQFDEDYQIYDLSPEEATRFEYRKGVEIKNGDYILKNTEEIETFPTGSKRNSRKGKGRFDLLPWEAIKQWALLMESGAESHGERNWQMGQDTYRYFDSAVRHLYNWIEGEREENHLSAALFNIGAIIWTEKQIKEGKLPKELDSTGLIKVKN